MPEKIQLLQEYVSGVVDQVRFGPQSVVRPKIMGKGNQPISRFCVSRYLELPTMPRIPRQ